ncbi:MAG: bifunctional nicotinamidase/pyrazinamidase [Alphaproteobacteria bacterium]|nr:bifunctional nicotinamidase/pyrazinamidase [Rhodospirillaceae bacterium]MBT6512141.1 bifunctional nicotinamidase/pyrazinamidase [Rhodospirillaceae bacterium]MBT7613574.1 bifunctional nicotinamidase/pyrazinamidase [Rhodospirillaceae bacterium]MDG2480939.1 bifunctional nicotinamidase/pyrazinamidase [Alphaproteobacteria bacterium]
MQKIDPSRDALIVVDIQNDFCPGGALAVSDGDAVVAVANALIPRFTNVVLTQDWHPAGHTSFASSHAGQAPFDRIDMSYGGQTLWPDHCVQGSNGAEFHRDLVTNSAHLVIRKGYDSAIDSYSAFYENDQTTPTGLTGYLRTCGISRVFLLGLATDYCVHYSTMDARKEGFDAIVIEDGCRAIDLDGSLARAMADMKAAEVIFSTSEQVAD